MGSVASNNIRWSSSYQSTEGVSPADAPVAKKRQDRPSSCSMGTISVRVFRSASSQVSNIERGGSDSPPSDHRRKSSGEIMW